MKHINSTYNVCKCVYYSVISYICTLAAKLEVRLFTSLLVTRVFKCVWPISRHCCCLKFSVSYPYLPLTFLIFSVSVQCPGGVNRPGVFDRFQERRHRRALRIKATTITATHSCVVSSWGCRHTNPYQRDPRRITVHAGHEKWGMTKTENMRGENPASRLRFMQFV